MLIDIASAVGGYLHEVFLGNADWGIMIGYVAQILFAMRFVVQWIASERAGRSVVPTAFWVFSIGGGLMLLGYALYRKDPVFIIGQAFGVFVYLRNLQFVMRRGGQGAVAQGDDMGLLDGDTGLVTGAASGIGRGIARALAAEGVRLVLSDVAVEPGEALARELGSAFIAADLAQPNAAKSLFDAAVAALGQISIFVHSAAPRRSEDQKMMAVTEEQWDAMLNVGLRSGFVLGQSVGA